MRSNLFEHILRFAGFVLDLSAGTARTRRQLVRSGEISEIVVKRKQAYDSLQQSAHRATGKIGQLKATKRPKVET